MNNLRTSLQSFYRFCPHCGRTFRKQMHGERVELVCAKCGYIHWLNPKPTASCLLLSGKNILLTKRAVNPYKGYWDVPGGFLEVGEHPEDGVKREIHEELGLRLPFVRLVGVYMDVYKGNPTQSTLNFYYTARIKKSSPITPQDDVEAAKWFSIHQIPKHIAFENGRCAVRDLKKRLK